MSEALRVLLVVNTVPPRDLSGAGEQVAQLAWALGQAGQHVEVLGRGRGGAPGPKVLFPLTVLWPGLRYVRELRPDVVQVHESDGGLLLALLRLVRRRRARPLLCALQQVSYREEVAAVRGLRDGGGQRLATPTASELVFRWVRGPVHVVLGRLASRCSDLVLAPSHRTGEELRRDYGVLEVARLPNVTGAPLAAAPATPAAAGESAGVERGPYFLFVGRLRIRKGVEVLLAAMERLRTRHPEARLLIVGDGERRRSIEREVRRLGLDPIVRLLGRQPPDRVRELLAGCRALVVPSTYEGMPLVVLEAMSASRPVVASAVSGIPEVVVDGETGWLVPREDVSALEVALAEAWSEPAEAERRGASGRRRVDAEFRPGHAAATWLRFARRQLGERCQQARETGAAARERRRA